MHTLENSIFLLSLADKCDEIGKAERVRIQRALASHSHWYVPDRADDADLKALHDELVRRFGHLVQEGG